MNFRDEIDCTFKSKYNLISCAYMACPDAMAWRSGCRNSEPPCDGTQIITCQQANDSPERPLPPPQRSPPPRPSASINLDNLFHHRKQQPTEHDRSYPRQTVAQVKIGASASRCSRVDNILGPGKPPWTMDTAEILETDIESVDRMADLLRDNDRPLSPQKRRQTPRPRR
jgi:hypothetical protein